MNIDNTISSPLIHLMFEQIGNSFYEVKVNGDSRLQYWEHRTNFVHFNPMSGALCIYIPSQLCKELFYHRAGFEKALEMYVASMASQYEYKDVNEKTANRIKQIINKGSKSFAFKLLPFQVIDIRFTQTQVFIKMENGLEIELRKTNTSKEWDKSPILEFIKNEEDGKE